MTDTIAYVALGSNLGDRSAQIESAIRMLHETAGVTVTRSSTVIETEPAAGSSPDQGAYLNAVVEVTTICSPQELLKRCLEIERLHGRERTAGVKWGPRTVDLDLILFGDVILAEPGLTLPHPHMHERVFVLRPLAELVPECRHPTLGKTIQCLLRELDNP